VLLVGTGILLLNLFFGHPPPPPGPPGAVGPAVVSPPGGADDPVIGTPSASGVPLPSDSSSAVDEPAPEPEPTAVDAPARAPLTVLNHSRISGLAAKAADDFRDGGWEVVEVGNTRLSVAETTVFFEPGQEASAAALLAQFPAVRRSAPRPAGLPGRGLTVVVTREYPR